MLHSCAQVAELLRLLRSGPKEPGWMTVGQVDGYVAALAVCPEPVPPSEWLPRVWGSGSMFVPAGPAGERTALAVIQHHNRLVRSLFAGPGDYRPVYEAGIDGGEPLWSLWIVGFVTAQGLRPAAWRRVRGGEGAASLSMIAVMYDIVMGRSRLREEAIAVAERTAPDLIPTFVRTLKGWSAWSRPEDDMMIDPAVGGAQGTNVVAFPGDVGAAATWSVRRCPSEIDGRPPGWTGPGMPGRGSRRGRVRSGRR